MGTHAQDIPVGELLQGVVDEMHEGVQVIGRDWRYLYVNETVARQGKRRKDELMGRTMQECYPGIQETPVFAQLDRCMRERVNVRMQNEFAYPDGTRGWFELFLHPVAQGLLVLSIDVTDRRRAEDALAKKIEELDKAVDLMAHREARMSELKELVERIKKLAPGADRSPAESP